MASKKIKTNNPTEVNGVPAVPDAVSAAAETDTPVTGAKLRWNSLKPADGVAHRTKKPKAKKSGATKTGIPKTEEDAAQTKKLSALDAAAKVLQESGQPMNCQEMIDAMAAKGYWTSPAGKTPAATLYSAIMRETKTKARQARFQKTARGHFVYQTPQTS
jgi:HB1/ASXL restriction endonuclease-like protein with HTH domain